MSERIFILLFALCLISQCQLSSSLKKTRYYKELQFEVPIDHFSFTSDKTFKIRYLQNDTYWDKRSGPIFFYTGNEGAIELFAEHTGFVWEIAEEFKALIIFAEHRYYGQSMPFGNKSFTTPEYTGYLTSMQALADYADLIYFLKKDSDPKSNNPVIAFGGSYGGMLSAYFRMKYPHIVKGAIAASAPLLEFQGMIPCDVFYRIVTSNFKVENNSCANSIHKSWSIIRDLTSTAEGRDWIHKEWNLCKKELAQNETQTLLDWLNSMYTVLAMVNYPYASDFMAPLPGYPVRQFCQYLTNDNLTGKPLLKALFSSISIFTNFTQTTTCNDIGGSTYNPDLGDLGWDYQACTEMVMPMCSTGKDDMFEAAPFDEKKFNSLCKSKWGVLPKYNLAEREYGGRNLRAASNIVFSNGLLDPWASGGILKNYSDKTFVVLIPEGAHHLDLMSSNKDDPMSVIIARKIHKQFIKTWIEN